LDFGGEAIALEFTLRYVVDYKQHRGKKDIIFSRFLASIHIVGIPAFNVKLVDNRNEISQ